MSVQAPYPWQLSLWSKLHAARGGGREPQALLIHGAANSGKGDFAVAWARAGLCASPTAQGMACLNCPPCQQTQAGSHPDLILERRAEDRREIVVDQVRAFCDRVRLTSAGARYGLLMGADDLNNNAANSLLKTLEEPPPQLHLILTASNLSRLPATIRSRCQIHALGPASADDARQWLQQHQPDAIGLLDAAGGNPVHAASLHDAGRAKAMQAWQAGLDELCAGRLDPLKLAAQIDAEDWHEFLAWWQRWLFRRMREEGGDALFEVWDELLLVRRRAHTPINRLLALEGLFILFARAHFRQRRKVRAA